MSHMQGSLDQPPIIVRSSPWTTLWALLVLLVFAGGAVGVLLDSAAALIMLPFRAVFVVLGLPFSIFFGLPKPDRLVAWILLFLFGCGSLILAHKMLWPDTLEIGPSGVHRRSFVRRWSFRWCDIGNFRPYVPGGGAAQVGFEHVGFEYVGDSQPQHPTREGIQSLGSGWELEPVELAKLLNAARARWIKNDPH